MNEIFTRIARRHSNEPSSQRPPSDPPPSNGASEEKTISESSTYSTCETLLPLQSVDRSEKANPEPKRRHVGRVLLLAATVALAAWLARDRLIDLLPIRRPPTTVTTASTIEKVVALGRLEPEGEVIEVAGPSGSGDARVQSLSVDIGDQVAAGQVLAVLDNNEQLQAQVAVAQSQVDQARKRLEQSRVIASTTRAQLQASLEAVRSQLQNAGYDLRRQEQLRKSKATSQQEYEGALLAFETAEKAVIEAESKLVRYSNDPEDSVDVQVTVSDVRVAEVSMQQAITVLDCSLVHAPAAGRILDIDLRPGERIGQQSLLRMGKTDKMMVRVEAYESDVSKIHAGQSAIVYAPAFDQSMPSSTLGQGPMGPQATDDARSDADAAKRGSKRSSLTGVVEMVATLVQQQTIVDSNPAANTDARVVEVLVRLDDESSQRAARFVGMQVTVEFPL